MLPADFKESLKKELRALGADAERFELLGSDREAHDEARAGIWEEKLRAAAAALRVSLEALPKKKSAAEKVQLAAWMKTTTSVSNGWLAKRLEMGKPGSVTQYVRRFRQGGGAKNRAFKSALSKIHT